MSDLLFLLNALFFSFLKLYRLRDPVAGGNLRSVCLSVCLCVHYLTVSDLLFLLNALFFSFLKLYRLRDPVAGGNLRSVRLSVCLSVCVFTISLCPTCCSCSTRCSSRSSSCTGSGIRWLVVTSGLSVCLSVCSLSHCVRPAVPAQRAVLLVPQAVQAQGSGGWW